MNATRSATRLRRSCRFGLGVLLASAIAAWIAAPAPASAPPVGPLPPGPVSEISAERGTLVAIALPAKPAASGLVWRSARPVDPAVLRQVSEADVDGSVVVVFRAVGVGSVTVAYALTRGETETALQTARYRVIVAPARCSAQPQLAAQYVIPPPPFAAAVVSVQLIDLPAGEPPDGGPRLKRLYRVRFDVLVGNPVLEAGRRYTQFAYVGRASTESAWCFVKGGSGP